MSIAELIAPPLPLQSQEYLFETEVFRQCWWSYLAPKFDIPFKNKDLLINRRKALKGLVKLHEARIAGWQAAWSQDLTVERIEELDALDQSVGWDYFRMIWNETRQDKQVLEILKSKGYPMMLLEAQPQHVIDLSAGFEGYLNSLSHNGRKSLKKKTRRGQVLNPQLVPVTREADIEPFFEELFKHHIAYWDERVGKSYFNDIEERNFTVQWAKALFRSGNLWLDRLIMGGETVNLSMAVVYGSQASWMLTINTGLHSEFVPGIIGLTMRLEQAAQNGITRFNMGHGDYFYKVQSANSLEPCGEMIVYNPRSLKAKVYAKYVQYLYRNRKPLPQAES